ncbi:SLOG family protein [Streptomyces sp. PvR018]|uniref:SLOG family protein n=1 Tax=Streptomyces sp. PvR018 TaxID=3156442 RepID=UPI00339B7DE4
MNGPYLALVLGLGSRAWTDRTAIDTALTEVWHDARQDGYSGIEVMEGTAPGADRMCGDWAKARFEHGVGHLPVEADWEGPCPDSCPPGHRRTRRDDTEFCPLAGHRRNQNMVDRRPLIALAFQVGESTGTADCLRRLKKAGIPTRRWPA